MNTRIKATNINLTPNISAYVERRMKKVSSFLNKDESAQCDIELARTTEHHNKGDIFRAEIHIVASGKNVYVSAEKEDLNTAIDIASSEAVRELQSKKGKRMALIRRGGANIKAMVKGLWPWGSRRKL